jgi:hypothetical protein
METLKEVMNSELSQKVAQVIEEMAKGLGLAVEHVYTILVNQMFYEGLVFSLICILGIFLTSLLIYLLWTKASDEGLQVVGTIMLGVLLVFTFVSLPNNLLKVFNPEYYAIKFIIESIK